MPLAKKVAVSSMVAAFGLLLTSSSTAASPCFQVELKERPLWISNATYLDEQKKLVLVDPFQNKLLAYAPSGETGNLPGSLAKEGERFQPMALSPLGKSGYLLEHADGTLVRLDKALRPLGGISPLQMKNAQGFHVGSMFQWKVAGDSVVAYGTLFDGTKVVPGFFRVPLGGQRAPEMLTPVPDTAFYVLGNSYITTAGDTAYYVVMSKSPAIYRVTSNGKAEKLNVVLPDELRTRPDFTTQMTGPSSAAQHYAELETFTLLSGIYSQGGMLYFLSRKADDWFIYKIDPREIDPKGIKPVVVSKGVRLPTTAAHHLTIVPTKSSWYLIERGAVQEHQRQEIARMDVVASSAIASGASLPNSCPPK